MSIQIAKESAEQTLSEAVAFADRNSVSSKWEGHIRHLSLLCESTSKTHVAFIGTVLGEVVGDVDRWTKASANDAGLDLMLYRPFSDGRTGLPVFMFQCASGGDWEGKLHTPNLRVWTKAIQFPSDPKKAFATPFAFVDSEFRKSANLVDGLLLDRLRLLTPGYNDADWVSTKLSQRIVKWLRPRVKELPLKY